MMEKARNRMILMKIIMIRWLIKMIKMIWIRARKKNHLQLFKKLKKEQVARSLGQQKIPQLYLWNFLIHLKDLTLINTKMNSKDMTQEMLQKLCLIEKKERYLDLF